MIEKSPFYELSKKHKVEIDYTPFIRVVGVSLKEFRSQRVEILTHTAIIFTSRTTVDSFFHICEEARITVPESMKYICQTEAVALYLQKYIVYRKRKISFADGSFTSLMELIVKHRDEKFLLALSEPHKPELPETLAKLKLSFDPVILARTVAADLEETNLRSYDLLALYSPSDVKVLVEKFGTHDLPAVGVFGEGTLRAALEAGLTVKAAAPTPEAPSSRPWTSSSRRPNPARRSATWPWRPTPARRSSSACRRANSQRKPASAPSPRTTRNRR